MDASTAARRESRCRPVMYRRRLRPPEPAAPGAAPARARRPPPPPSPDRFRGVRIFDISDLVESQAGGRRAELPRLAHAHAGDRPERQGQRLYLHLRHRHRSPGGRAGGLLGRRSRRPIPTPRCSASTSSRCRWRIPSWRRSYPARASLPMRKPEPSTASGRAATTAKAPRPHRSPTSATTSRSIRPSAWRPARVPATESCWIFPTP